jgi:type III restriction enzyme
MSSIDKGAHYIKSDLQVHTPRDPNWRLNCDTDGKRQKFAVEFIEACRNAGIGAVAITDHHDFGFVPWIRKAAAAERDEDGEVLPAKSRLVVFPGLELTLAVPCQALLIFSADFPDDRLSAVLEKLGIDPAGPEKKKAKDPAQLGFQTFKELYERLDETKWLRGEYTVLPNVTDGGHGTLMRSQFYAKYREMPCVGGYLDGSVEKIGDGNRRAFEGKDSNRDFKRIAVIQTSDARTLTSIGKNASWIKWAEPTAEALRQACLAEESRISHAEPQLPGVVITELRVSNSKFLGPVGLTLNPQYNALIGGRGTGKSTCLEYLRWALCDQPPELEDDDDVPNHASRRARLIAQTLEPFSATVEVDFVLNGISHMVRRYAETGRVKLKIGKRELKDATPEEIRALLSIEAYSQRQLSSVGVRLDELTRFVVAPIRERLGETGTKADEIAAQARQNYADLQRQRALEKVVSQENLALASLTQQAKNMREGLTGLKDEDRACLAQRQGYEEADNLVASWVRSVEQASEEVEALRVRLTRIRSELESIDKDLPEADLLAAIEATANAALEHAQDGADVAGTALDKAQRKGSDLKNSNAAWVKALKAFNKRYAAATERSSAHASKLEELEGLERRQQAVRETIAEARAELATLGDPVTVHEELRVSWREVQSERSTVMEEQCERLTELSGGLIRASIRRNAGAERLLDPFKAAISGSGVHASKVQKFLSKVSESDDPLAAWLAAMDELEDRVLRSAEAGDLPPLQSALAAFSETDMVKIVKKVAAERVLELSLLPLNDQPLFEYQRKESDYIEFADASAGQQATALLQVLLNQPGPPLIIDQPEDDLDSQVILDIVNQIWEAKHRRQLIFSSHNANLVVNGDAELVICCHYRKAGDHSGGTIKLQGAIDIPKIRKEITQVMEGGEKAFRLRKEKYGF